MYRTTDEAFMSGLRHQIMVNEGTHWLRDRRWSVHYLTKFLALDDLHRWAHSKCPADMIPLGVGRLDAVLTIVARRWPSEDEWKLLAEELTGVSYYVTILERLDSEQLDAVLLQKEVEVVSSPVIATFGVPLKLKSGIEVINFEPPITQGALTILRERVTCEQVLYAPS